jgi:dihydroxy-acid dehydratase
MKQPEGIAEECAELRAQGHRAIKLRIGLGQVGLDDAGSNPLTRPVFATGIVVLRGNLAISSVTRPMVIRGERSVFRGPAKVFDSLEEAVEGIVQGKIVRGDVLVLRYEGPRGGPGLTDIFSLMGHLGGMGQAPTVRW